MATLSCVREFEAGGALGRDKCIIYGRQHSHSLVHLNFSRSGCLGVSTLSHARPLTWARRAAAHPYARYRPGMTHPGMLAASAHASASANQQAITCRPTGSCFPNNHVWRAIATGRNWSLQSFGHQTSIKSRPRVMVRGYIHYPHPSY